MASEEEAIETVFWSEHNGRQITLTGPKDCRSRIVTVADYITLNYQLHAFRFNATQDEGCRVWEVISAKTSLEIWDIEITFGWSVMEATSLFECNFYIQMDTAIWWSTSIHCNFVPSLVPRLPGTQNVHMQFLLTWSWCNRNRTRVFGTERQRFVNFVHVENNCACTPYVNIELCNTILQKLTIQTALSIWI